LLFAFDKKRKAVLLVGGDKSDDWKGWYTTNIPIADDRLDWHQKRSTSKKRSKGNRPRVEARSRKEGESDEHGGMGEESPRSIATVSGGAWVVSRGRRDSLFVSPRSTR